MPGNYYKYDVVDGFPLGPVMRRSREVCSETEIPFAAKGVLSVQDAVKVDAGCKG